MKKIITVTVQTENQQEIIDFWQSAFQLRKNKSAIILQTKLGDFIQEAELYKKYAKALVGNLAISPVGADIRIDPVGEHWWQHVGGFFANNPDFFTATKVYPSLEELEKVEGKTSIKAP